MVVIGSRRNFQSYTAGATRAGLARSALREGSHSVLQAAEILRKELQPGDVLLIKGRTKQHLERIAPLPKGHNVRCDIGLCRIKATACAQCSMLEGGWAGTLPLP